MARALCNRSEFSLLMSATTLFATTYECENLEHRDATEIVKSTIKKDHTKVAKTAKRFGNCRIFASLAIFCSKHRRRNLREKHDFELLHYRDPL